MVVVPAIHLPVRGAALVKSAREQLDIVNAYAELGSYRAAAELCGTTHKTVRRIIQRHREGTLGQRSRPPRRPRNTDPVSGLIARRVKETDGRISAKRLLPEARAAGYAGSARNFRRAVAPIRADWRRRRRVYRPWLPSPGEHLVIDWGTEGGWQVFCAVLAWSRVRFVRFACDQRRETTLGLLAECLEVLGGVPRVVLADRMACLKAGVVANVVVPHPDYVRLAAHYGFRPDFCEAADPESKGVVEALVGYAKADLLVPAAGGWRNLADANAAAAAWCAEVNARVHTQTCAVPAERLATEREVLRPLPSLRPPLRRGETRKVDRLATVRFGSARYSVPARLVGLTVEVAADDREVRICQGEVEVARHRLVAPGEASITDDHYGGPRAGGGRPSRAIRPRSQAEQAFVALGPAAEQFLRAAAAAGTPRLATELAAIVALATSHGEVALVAALERAATFRRFSAEGVRAVLAAGPAAPAVTEPGQPLALALPQAPTRSLAAYAPGALR
jgi:transposase